MYIWNFNEKDETWDDDNAYKTIEECIAAVKKVVSADYAHTTLEDTPRAIYIGELVDYEPTVDVDYVLEALESQAFDFSEQGEDWGASDYKKKGELKELEEKLTGVVTQWLKKHNRYPNFKRVENIKRHWLE
jgi:hypothetical protein